LIITVNSTYKSKDVRVISPKILNFCSSFVPVCPHVMIDFLNSMWVKLRGVFLC
jgi:hypothetical protein